MASNNTIEARLAAVEAELQGMVSENQALVAENQELKRRLRAAAVDGSGQGAAEALTPLDEDSKDAELIVAKEELKQALATVDAVQKKVTRLTQVSSGHT